jgi:very-short-patch-repair endonuclease
MLGARRLGVAYGRRRNSALKWSSKYKWRRSHEDTKAERRLWSKLGSRISRDQFLIECWLEELDLRVDCLIEPAKLVIEVDGPSHIGREAEDRQRSLRIRAKGFEIARVTNEDVPARGDVVATQIAERVRPAVREALRQPTTGWPNSRGRATRPRFAVDEIRGDPEGGSSHRVGSRGDSTGGSRERDRGGGTRQRR